MLIYILLIILLNSLAKTYNFCSILLLYHNDTDLLSALPTKALSGSSKKITEIKIFK